MEKKELIYEQPEQKVVQVRNKCICKSVDKRKYITSERQPVTRT